MNPPPSTSNLHRACALVALVAGCMFQVVSFAQGALPPCDFEWDAPTNMTSVVGYRLEWGPQDYADVPVHQTLYEVAALPVGLNLPVSVYSLSSTTNSEPETIHLFNVEVAIEESTDLQTWTTAASVLVRGQRKPTSFLRLKLQSTP